MRAGAIISAFAHAAVLLLWVMLGTPKPFDESSAEPVTVDLVPPEEAPPQKPPEEAKPPETKPPETKPAEVKPETPPPPLIPPRPDRITERPTTQPPQAQTKPASPTPAPRPQPPAPAPSAAAQPQPAPQAPPQPPAQPQPAPQAPMAAPSIFDPASIPKLAEITPVPPAPSAPSIGFDSAAIEVANLTREEVAAFKSHLKKCLKLPSGMDASRNVRVVLRVFLRTDGALAADPMLIEAPAAKEGPVLLQAATKALKDCQPYAFLPAEKYNEWKILDLPISPGDMAGS
jgi:hypothetical protein